MRRANTSLRLKTWSQLGKLVSRPRNGNLQFWRDVCSVCLRCTSGVDANFSFLFLPFRASLLSLPFLLSHTKNREVFCLMMQSCLNIWSLWFNNNSISVLTFLFVSLQFSLQQYPTTFCMRKTIQNFCSATNEWAIEQHALPSDNNPSHSFCYDEHAWLYANWMLRQDSATRPYRIWN